MKRDSLGRTVSVRGKAGKARPGTTLDPRWLELERHSFGLVFVDSTGMVNEAWLDRYRSMGLHSDDKLRVVSLVDGWASHARVTKEGTIAIERAPLARCEVTGRDAASTPVLITRIRGVPSCALDVADQGPQTNEQTGDAVGRHRTLVAREIKRALAKAVRAAAQMGMSEDELMRGLEELRRQSGRV